MIQVLLSHVSPMGLALSYFTFVFTGGVCENVTVSYFDLPVICSAHLFPRRRVLPPFL
jgi:2-keto-3-deoxy-6-phosphogluconate aldolase